MKCYVAKYLTTALLSLAFILAVSLPGPVLALTPVGTISAISGEVDIMRDGKLPAIAASVGAPVGIGDFIRTKSNSRAEIRFTDGNVIKVAQRSRIDISEYASARDARTIGLTRGKLEAIVVPPVSRQPQKVKRFEVHTPNAVAGVRGTDLFVFYEANTTGVTVRELSGGDDVYAYNLADPNRVVDVPERKSVLIREGQPPGPLREAGDAELQGHLRDVTPSETATGTIGNEGFLPFVSQSPTSGYFQPPLTETTPSALGAAAPSVQVGQVAMTGLGVVSTVYDVQVTGTFSFLASNAAAAPTIWRTTSLSGSWTPLTAGPAFNPTGTTIGISGTGPVGTANASVTFTGWNTGAGTWNAGVNGSGIINGGNVAFSGSAAGTGASGAISGTFSGSGSGSVSGLLP